MATSSREAERSAHASPASPDRPEPGALQADRPEPGALQPDRPHLSALRYDADAGTLWALDQRVLPWREEELPLRSAAEVAEAIQTLAIRGAPLIGVAAAYGIALELRRDPDAPEPSHDPEGLERACQLLRGARPTAVNLAYAVDRVQAAVGAGGSALAEAEAIEREEAAASDVMAAHGAEYLSGTETILTHCNTGALAAPGRGTALAVVAELAARGSVTKVIATESRPLLQGARLTAYELRRLGIPHELIVDSAAAGLIASGAVQAVIVGCDRVAANGDVANKVGTYALALAARAADIPFVVAGPTSTIDAATPSGRAIVIEERDPDEVRHAGGRLLTLEETACRNPAFDVTPAELVTALVTERGVVSPLSQPALGSLLA